MKSLKIINLIVLLITLTSLMCARANLKLSSSQAAPATPATTGSQALPEGLKSNNITEVFATLFTDPTRENYVCPCKKTPEQLQAEAVNITEDGSVWAAPQKKQNFHEKKKIGWEASAYFIDYIDPVLQVPIVKEFERIFAEAQKIPAAANFKDPYSLESILGLTGTKVPPKDEMVKKITALSPNFKLDSWEKSISVAQIESIIKQWGWASDPTKQFPAKFLLDKFDFDGDGRLSAREFIVATIHNNRKIVQSKKCKNCLETLSESLIEPIFMYLDCANTGLINSEQIWRGIQKLKRNTKGFNIFKCQLDETGKYRTSAINDFILKAHKSVEGKINKEEFRLGLFLAYWDRHVDDKIYLDDTRNMKKLRWANEGNVDIVCERIRNQIKKQSGI